MRGVASAHTPCSRYSVGAIRPAPAIMPPPAPGPASAAASSSRSLAAPLNCAAYSRRVGAVAGEQLGVRTLLDDVAVLHDEDDVGVADRRQAVRDDEAGPVAAQRGHRVLDQQLGPGVDRRRRLVEDQQLRCGEERPRDGEQLLLARRDVAGLGVELGLVPLGQRVDEPVDVGGPSRLEDLLLGGVRTRVRDVLPDRALEQPGVLQHHADPRPQVVPRHVGDVDAVQGDPAGVQLVEPHDEVHQRRLARPGRTDDGDGLARLDAQVEALDERLVGRVGERHVLEGHASLGRPDLGRRGGLRVLLGRVEHVEHPLGRGHPGLEQVGHRGHLRQRLGELARVLDERLDITEAHRPGRDP